MRIASYNGMFCFFVSGYVLVAKNTKKQMLSFSERYRFVPCIKFSHYCISLLKDKNHE